MFGLACHTSVNTTVQKNVADEQHSAFEHSYTMGMITLQRLLCFNAVNAKTR